VSGRIRRISDIVLLVAMPLLAMAAALAVWNWYGYDSLYAFEHRYHFALPNPFLWLPALASAAFLAVILAGGRRSRTYAVVGLIASATIAAFMIWGWADGARTAAMPYPSSWSFLANLIGVPLLEFACLLWCPFTVFTYIRERRGEMPLAAEGLTDKPRPA
jgi:hypothetical protein